MPACSRFPTQTRGAQSSLYSQVNASLFSVIDHAKNVFRPAFFFFFLAVQHGLWDLSSQPRDGTWAPVVRDSLHGARRGRRGLLRGGSSSGRRAQRRLSPTSGFPLCPQCSMWASVVPRGASWGFFCPWEAPCRPWQKPDFKIHQSFYWNGNGQGGR